MSGMKLPNAENARVDEKKITEYLLCASHQDGAGKAAFFGKFGFKVAEWHVLAEVLREHGRRYSVQKSVESAYGTRYSIDGEVKTPSGRRPMIRSVWIVDKGSKVPRLITAHPA